MAGSRTSTEDWRTLPWKTIHKNVFRLQRRIYQAARRNDVKRVHDLQRLLLRSWGILLANVALHGLETALTNTLPAKCKPGVIRYADDRSFCTTTWTRSTAYATK